MANILDQITIGDVSIVVVDAIPSASAGTAAAQNSIAFFNGAMYLKSGSGDTAWDNIPTVAVDLAAYFELAGRAGGQVANGGTAASDSLTFHSTTDATKGKINFGSVLGVDEASSFIGFGTTNPTSFLHALQNTVESKVDFSNTTSTDASTNHDVALYTPAADTVSYVHYVITGLETTTKDSIVLERTTRVKNVGGVVSLVTTQADYTSRDTAISTATAVPTVSGSDVVLRIKGVAAHTINWKVKREVVL